MKEKLILLRILALLLLLGSCKAYRNVENLEPKVSKEAKEGPFVKSELSKLVPGDKILVEATTGFKYYLIYQNYTSDNLVGSAWKVNDEKLETPKPIEIPFGEIDQIRVWRVSAGATAPIVVLGTMGIIVAIAAIVWSSGGGYGW